MSISSKEDLIVEDSSNPDPSASQNDVAEQERPKSIYKMRLEIAAFLVYFGVNASSPIFQDQILYQTCRVVYGYNETLCEDLGRGRAKSDPEIKAIDNIVQPFAAKIFMTESLVRAIVPAFLALFIGSWTDKFGRRPVMLVTITGYLVFLSIKAIIAGISLWQDVNPWVYIIASVSIAMCGGNSALHSAIYCYVADLTTLQERPIRMCIMAGIISLGDFLGQLSSGYLYFATNACTVFVMSAVAQLIALIYVILFIKESLQIDKVSVKSKFKGLLDRTLVKDMLKTVFKKRKHFQTSVIWCIIIPMAAVALDTAGNINVIFLFLRNKFGWTVQNYTTFNSIRIVLTFIGATASIIILQIIFRVKLTTMSLIAYGSFLVRGILYATAQAPWYMYMAIAITCLNGLSAPMGQSMITNTVSPSDIGKVFTLVSALQAIVPLVGAPLYTFVYNSTFESYPGAYSLISVGLYLMCFIMTGLVHLVEFKYPNVNVAKAR